MGKRIVAFTRNNVAIGIYDSVEIASKETGVSKHDISRNIRGFGSKYVKDLTFEFEITNKELREVRLRDRKQRQAQWQEELNKRLAAK